MAANVERFVFFADTVRGVCLALQHALEHRDVGAEVFNIGAPKSVSILEAAQLVQRQAMAMGILDEPLPIELEADLYTHTFDDTWDRAPDIARAREVLGFEPEVSFEVGLRATLAHYHRTSHTQKDCA